MMNISDAIVSKSFVEEKEYTEEEIIRMGYEKSYAEDWVDDTITINKFELSDMRVNPEQEKKNGGSYYSSKCILACYNDDQEVQIPFFIENFKNYDEETGILVVGGKNVLARLVQKLDDEGSLNNKPNRFEVKFEILQEVINSTTDVPITVKEFVKPGGYTDYTIE